MKRPDQHVIADEAEHRLRAVLPSEWVVRKVSPDYGVDFEVELVDQHILTGNRVWIQLKGTRSLRRGTAKFESASLSEILELASVEEEYASFTLDKKEIDYALCCPFPLLLVVVDVESGATYWHPIRDEFVTRFGRSSALMGQESATLRIPAWNRLDSDASDRLDGLRWYAVEPSRMYAFARLHFFVHEFQYRARLSGYSIGDGWIDNGEEVELRHSLALADEYITEALSFDVLFNPTAVAPIAMFAQLRELLESGRAAAKTSLELLECGKYTFQEMAVSLGRVDHGVDMLSTTIASYDGYRTRYLLVEANVVFRIGAQRLGLPPQAAPYPTTNDPNKLG